MNYLLKRVEHYCKVPKTSLVGTINDLNYPIDPFPPQENIHTSSCGEYWKEWPSESNALDLDEGPVVIHNDQIELPPEKQFGNNNYSMGIIDYAKLANLMSDEGDSAEKIFEKSEEHLIDPETKQKLEYSYELKFRYTELNKLTWKNRWDDYNPMISMHFPLIESPIKEINELNRLFKKKIDDNQRHLLSNNDLILYGLISFDIFKYKIQQVRYINNNPIYIIHIVLYRENDLFMPCFAYIGWIDNTKPIITNIAYIGHYAQDSLLLPSFSDSGNLTSEILNSNFSNAPVVNRDPDSIVDLTKKHLEEYKIKNQYACFNLHYDSENRKSEPILMYYNKDYCESTVDFVGRPKEVGIWDKPCKKDDECPYFKENKNYENTRGKCLESGYCELPLNMEAIGYHYYKNDTKPLCYNCNSNKFNIASTLNTCCDEQNDKEKYPYLKGPDYSFESDFLERKNYFNQKFCKNKIGDMDSTCSDFYA